MGQVMYPKPRYTVEECCTLLSISRAFFYINAKNGKYSITKDGNRTYMTHAQLLAAAEGENWSVSDEHTSEPELDVKDAG